MSALLTIRQAAERLGVSMDTLRQWERIGRLSAERTQGGHRRFRLEEIERLDTRRSKTEQAGRATPGLVAQTAPAVAAPRGGSAPASTHLEPFWQGELREARARVELKRLRRESIEHQAEIDKRQAQNQRAQEATKRRELQIEQLRGLKEFGRSLVPSSIGAEGRAEITSDLEAYVTAERFPPELPTADARVLLQARVGAALSRLEQLRAAAAAQAEREHRRAIDQRLIELLIDSGQRVARRETQTWHTVDQFRALSDVEKQLREEVRADWGYAQVEALVTEILSEFEELDDEDEAAESLEDDEEDDVDEED